MIAPPPKTPSSAPERLTTDDLAPKVRAVRLTMKFKYALWSSLVCCVVCLVAGGATVTRLYREARQVDRAQVLVAATWMADRLASEPATRRADILRGMSRRLGFDCGLYDLEGVPLTGGALGAIEPSTLRALFSGEPVEDDRFGGVWLAGAAVQSETGGFLVVARQKNAPRPGWLRALLRLTAFGLLLCIASAFFGYAFGGNLSEYLRRLRTRLYSMIDQHRGAASPPKYEEPSALDLSDIDRAALELESRFRAEFAMYKDALDEIEVLDKQRNAYLGEVSRELIRPLVAILEHTESLLDGAHGPMEKAQIEDLVIVKQAGVRLHNMVSEVLDLSNLDTTGIDMDEDPVDLHEVAEEVVATARGQLCDKPVELVLEKRATSPALVRGSRQRIWQVLTNLVSNAIKFTDEGHVRVTVGRSSAGEICATVEDTGSGILQSEHETIFDPFAQSCDAKKKKRGYGLGLAISNRLVELHGGRIELESEVGVGSKFIVLLPEMK